VSEAARIFCQTCHHVVPLLLALVTE